MTDVAETVRSLTARRDQMDELGKRQAQLLEYQEPMQALVSEWKAIYNSKLWLDHLATGSKYPSKEVRDQLAVTEPDWPASVATKLAEVNAEIELVTKQISNAKILIDADRSILSALKLELEATV